ncbi:MAG TPA: isoprenylcysteine carboxylmethyltransferase family protein [Terracidiphilus sp.]|nr:isoprenylcysteine carboxylmethyltransferase family protein [Terracidiphilus sp.]
MASLRSSFVVTVLFAVLGGPGFVLVYIPWWMTHFRIPTGEPGWQWTIAAAMISMGIVPLIGSMFRFVFVGRGTMVPAVPTERLVISGLYRYVRNPMYLGVLLSLAGEALLFRSRDIVVEALTAWLAAHVFILVYEEPTLARRHPDEYPLYKRNVPRWVPRATPWTGEPH